MPRPRPSRAFSRRCSHAPSQPFSTNSNHPAISPPPTPATATATARPVLDFLYPGFGFFSRSLPPLVPRSPSSVFPGPPPPPPVPISSHGDSPHYRSKEGKNLLLLSLSSSSSCSSTTTRSTPPTLASSWRTTKLARVTSCECGRRKEICLRCRSKSTDSTTTSRRQPLVRRVERDEVEQGTTTSSDSSGALAWRAGGDGDLKGKMKQTDSTEQADALTSYRSFFKLLDSALPSSRTSTSNTSRSRSTSSLSASLSSFSRSVTRKHLKRLYLVSNPSTTTSSSSSPSPSPLPASSISRTLFETLSNSLSNPAVWNGLNRYEQLDSIRFFSRIVRLFRPPSPSPSPSSSSSSSSTSFSSTSRSLLLDQDDGGVVPKTRTNEGGQEMGEWFKVRELAGQGIEKFLERFESDDAEGRGRKDGELSKAGLWIDSYALRNRVLSIPLPRPLPSLDDGEKGKQRGVVDKLEESIRKIFGRGREEEEEEDDEKRKKRVQAIRTGLSNLFESWSFVGRTTTTTTTKGRTPKPDEVEEEEQLRGGGERDQEVRVGELAFKLIYEYDLKWVFDATTTTSLSSPPPPASTTTTTTTTKPSQYRQEVGYNDVLKRQYGLLLGRLKPSPVEWLESSCKERGAQGEEELVPRGLHLVEYLSRSGSAGEARKVWERISSSFSEQTRKEVQGGGRAQDHDRLKSLTALVDGLTMEGFYEDANVLTDELENLAKAVDELESGGGTDTVLRAYRVLAKLASNQGRPLILERLLKKINAITSSSPSSSLELFVRRLRSKASRYDIKAVRSYFDEVQASTEWEQASKEDQAKLWSQVIVAETRVNDVEGAIESVRSLVSYGLRPPLAVVNSVLFGFARRGDVGSVDSLFEQLVRGEFDRLRPDAGSWNALVLARTTAKDPSAAARVVAEMRASSEGGGGGVSPNRQTWTTLMAGFVDSAQWRQAFEIYRFLEQHPSIDMRPDTATTNVILKACVLTSTPASSVISLFRQLLLRGFRPNMMTYTLVLQSLTSAGLMDLAEELYLMMLPSPAPSPSTSLTPSSPSWPKPNLPTSMTPVRPDHFIYSTLIAGYLKLNERTKAKATLAEMRRRGLEPTSITLAIVVGSQFNESSTPMKVRQMTAAARHILREEGRGLTRLRNVQPPRKDRRLAMGDEAVAIFGPIFQSAAEQGLGDAALELLEEIQSRRRTDEVPVELYTMLMDAFRRVDDAQIAADNVKLVWDRVYESVASRFVTLKSSPSTPLPSRFTSHDLTNSRLDLRVDPAHASVLSLPLTILLDTLARADRHHGFGVVWRALARQGFSFDASNWNTLALYFARDLQLERAFWIAEHVLCRPLDDSAANPSSSSPSSSDFESEFASVTRSTAIARSSSRINILRQHERDRQRKEPVDIPSLLSSSPPSADLEVSDTVRKALEIRQATFWHPYGTLLEALESALETLTVTGDQPAGGNDDSGTEIKEKLVRDHPRTMQAIDLWRTRGQRKDRERERWLSVKGVSY